MTGWKNNDWEDTANSGNLCNDCKDPIDKDGNAIYETSRGWDSMCEDSPCSYCETSCETCNRQYCGDGC